MEFKSFATKYRPQYFNDVVGQEEIKIILQKQIEADDLKSAYLFFGPSGTGKTTSARCMANSVNGSLHGIVEVDAASNSGVDNMREILESSKYKPIGIKKKFYIVDECHSLSTQSWQSVLKTIEDGVKDSVFIFCTTEKHKVPATIISRCQVFDLKRVSSGDIKKRLQFIQTSENKEFGECKLQVTDECLDYIAKLANGGMRLAITMYEKVINYSTNPSIEDVAKILGTSSYSNMFDIIDAVYDRKYEVLVEEINKLDSAGANFRLVAEDLVNFIIELTKYVISKKSESCSIPKYYLETKDTNYDMTFLTDCLQDLLSMPLEVRNMDNPKNYILGKLLLI